MTRPFLEWLRTAPAGRGFRTEIEEPVLATRKGPDAVDERRHYLTNREQSSRERVHSWAPGAPAEGPLEAVRWPLHSAAAHARPR